jgi:sugar lactone lactonase YvrE
VPDTATTPPPPPPDTTAITHYLTAVRQALTLPPPRRSSDHLPYLRLLDQRARLARDSISRLLTNPQPEPPDYTSEGDHILHQLADLPPSTYRHHHPAQLRAGPPPPCQQPAAVQRPRPGLLAAAGAPRRRRRRRAARQMTRIGILLTGRGLVESPRWHGDRLYFSDWSAGEVVAVDLAGRSEVIARVKSLPLCTAWLPDGRLVIVSSPDGRLLRREPGGELVTHADLGRPGWNDIVVDGRGNAYVNGAGFNPVAGEAFSPGFVVLVTADGSVRQVAEDIAFPNGMAVTPGNSSLIVADSYRHSLVAFDIGADGGLSNRRIWADLGNGTPDGICLDAQNAVWYADVPGKRCVRVAEGGPVLQTIELDRGGFACALGGPGRTTLFITAAQWLGMTGPEMVQPGSGQVLTARVDVPGAGWP